MKNLWKHSGILLIATGTLHTIVAIALFGDYLWNIVKDVLSSTLESDDVSQGLAFWFFVLGFFIIILGQILHHYIKKEQQPAPKSLGYWLLGLGVIGGVIVPVSGFWLFIPQALIILFAKGKQADPSLRSG